MLFRSFHITQTYDNHIKYNNDPILLEKSPNWPN